MFGSCNASISACMPARMRKAYRSKPGRCGQSGLVRSRADVCCQWWGAAGLAGFVVLFRRAHGRGHYCMAGILARPRKRAERRNCVPRRLLRFGPHRPGCDPMVLATGTRSSARCRGMLAASLHGAEYIQVLPTPRAHLRKRGLPFNLNHCRQNTSYRFRGALAVSPSSVAGVCRSASALAGDNDAGQRATPFNWVKGLSCIRT